MTHQTCSEQSDVIAAAADCGALSDALRSHLQSCQSCREEFEAVTLVRGLAAESVVHPLPDPAVIWWKAQLLRRWQAERAVTVPIQRMRWVELAAGIASLVVFLVWQWQALANLVLRGIPSGVQAAAGAARGTDPMITVLLVGAAASVAGMVLVMFHRRLSGSSV
jgi:predicted anti-sigma-YlaC factor YlaD